MAKYEDAPQFLIDDLEASVRRSIKRRAAKRGVTEDIIWNETLTLAKLLNCEVKINKDHPEKSLVSHPIFHKIPRS